MPAQLDHLIVNVNDARVSVAFYARVLGFTHEGEDGPFSVLRVNESLTLQLAPWGTTGGAHLAFALTGDVRATRRPSDHCIVQAPAPV